MYFRPQYHQKFMGFAQEERLKALTKAYRRIREVCLVIIAKIRV
jgi:hypothetical protein